jgi:hypothetical protein
MSGKPSPKRMFRSLLAASAMALVAVGLAACGSTVSTSSFTGEEKAVAQRISELQSDATASDEKKVCQNDLAASVEAKLKTAGSDCEAALKHQLTQIDILEMKVESVRVSGKTASAVVESTWSGKGHKSTVILVKESGSWKIMRLA